MSWAKYNKECFLPKKKQKSYKIRELAIRLCLVRVYSWFSLLRHKILKSKSVDERSQEFLML